MFTVKWPYLDDNLKTRFVLFIIISKLFNSVSDHSIPGKGISSSRKNLSSQVCQTIARAGFAPRASTRNLFKTRLVLPASLPSYVANVIVRAIYLISFDVDVHFDVTLSNGGKMGQSRPLFVLFTLQFKWQIYNLNYINGKRVDIVPGIQTRGRR